jgi:hypothetical protein
LLVSFAVGFEIVPPLPVGYHKNLGEIERSRLRDAVASASAKAFVPLMLAAIIGGAAVGGTVLGSAATNSYYNPTYVAPVAVVPEPSVTVGSTICHFAHRWVNGVRERMQVCHTVSP